ncbi:MAG: hypothetical protein Q7S22_08180, partial [Candidatus Micrarchaeota archaeon]|nr:hypothetical protein [Candidatus Micrarchaeota archaeon]
EGSVKKSVVAKPDGAIASEPTVEAGATPASVETSALNPAELESRRQLLLGRAKAVLGDSNTIQDNRVFVREANRSLADGKDVQKALNKNDLTEANRILDVAEWSIYYTELNTRTNVLRNEGLLIDSWDATNPIFYNLGLYEIGGGNRDQPFAIVKLKLDESNAAITQFERNAAVDKYNEANIAFGKLTASTDNVIQEKIIKLHSEIANLQDLLDSKLPQNYIQLYWRAKKDLDEANSIAASVASVAKSEAPVVNLAEKTSEPIEGSVKAKFEELTRLLTEAQRANEQAGKNNWTKLDVESQKSLSHEASTFLSHNQFAEADGKITAAIDSFPRIYLTAAQTAHANSNTIYTDFGPRNGIDKKYQKEYDSLGNELGEFSSQFLDNVSDLSSAVIAYQKSVDLYSRILAFNEKTHAPIDAPVVSKRTTVNFKDSETGFTPASGAEEKPAELDFDSSVVDSLSLSRRADEQQARINKLNDANPRLRDSLSTINNSLNQENTGVYALIKGGTPIQLNEADAKLNDVTNALDNLEASSSANLSKSIIVVIADMDRLKAAGLGYEDMGKNRKILVDLNEVVLKGNPTPKETGLIQFINNDFARIVKIIADDQKVAAENLVATAPNKADLLKLAVEASDDTTRAIEYNRVANAVKPAVSVEVILPTGTLLESINYIRDTINEMGTTGYDQAVLQKQLEQLNDIARKLPKKATQSQQLKSMGGLETIADNLNIEIKKQQQYAMTSRILAKDVYDSTDNEDQKTKASAFLDSAARFMKDGSYPKASAEYETARVFLYATLRASSSNLSISKPIAESVVTAESITDDFKKLNERVTGMKDSGYGKMQDVSELIGSMQNNLNNNTLKKNGIYLFETTVAIANINTYLDSVVEQRKAADISFVTLMKKIGTDGAIIKNPVLNLKTSGQQLYVQQKYRQAKQKYDEALVALQTTLVPTVGLRSPVIPESDYYSQVRFSTKAVAVYIGTLNPTAVVTATLTPNATVNFRDMLKDESTRVLFTAVEVTNEETRYTLIPAGLSISRKDAIKLEHTTVLEGDGIFIFLKDGGVVDAQQNNKSPLPSDVAKVKIGSYTQGRDGSIRINWDSIDKRYDQYVLGTITGNDIIDQLDKSKKYVLPQDTKISFIVSTYKGIHSNPRSRYIWQVGMQ